MGIYMGMYVWCEWDIQYADPDPGGQKWPTKNGKPTKCDVLNSVLRIRIRDPGSGAFWPLDPGSGIGFFRISDPGSREHIFKSFLTIFLVKSSIILWKLAQIFCYFLVKKLKNCVPQLQKMLEWGGRVGATKSWVVWIPEYYLWACW